MCVNKSIEKKQSKKSKIRSVENENKTIKSEYCFCNCAGCGFDRHCGGAFCYYKVNYKSIMNQEL